MPWWPRGSGRGGSGVGFRRDVGHDREHVAVGVVEEGHPVLDAGRVVLVDAVRGALKLDAPLGQLVMSLSDVGYEEVQNRARTPLLLADLVDVEPHPAAIEEDQV